MDRIGLSDEQAGAALGLKLRHLARLEEMKIRREQRALNQEKTDLERTFGSERRMKTLVGRELRQDADKYSDERSSPIRQRTAVRRARPRSATRSF